LLELLAVGVGVVIPVLAHAQAGAEKLAQRQRLLRKEAIDRAGFATGIVITRAVDRARLGAVVNADILAAVVHAVFELVATKAAGELGVRAMRARFFAIGARARRAQILVVIKVSVQIQPRQRALAFRSPVNGERVALVFGRQRRGVARGKSVHMRAQITIALVLDANIRRTQTLALGHVPTQLHQRVVLLGGAVRHRVAAAIFVVVDFLVTDGSENIHHLVGLAVDRDAGVVRLIAAHAAGNDPAHALTLTQQIARILGRHADRAAERARAIGRIARALLHFNGFQQVRINDIACLMVKEIAILLRAIERHVQHGFFDAAHIDFLGDGAATATHSHRGVIGKSVAQVTRLLFFEFLAVNHGDIGFGRRFGRLNADFLQHGFRSQRGTRDQAERSGDFDGQDNTFERFIHDFPLPTKQECKQMITIRI